MKNKFLKRTLWTIAIVFIMANIMAAFQAYRFTHFGPSDLQRTKDGTKLSFAEKVQTVLFGVNLPKPLTAGSPWQPYQTVELQSLKKIKAWHIIMPNAKGTCILFHGYGGDKSSMLSKSDELVAMGYSTLLVDFMGCGESEGNQTTIGYKEAQDVKTCYNYIAGTGEKKIYLIGTSMGAAAIIKALHDYPLQPAGIIVECPFGSMYQTTCGRFQRMGLPSFPMASLLIFWGSVENGFWAFHNRPSEFAKSVKCPVLLLYGERDEKVSRAETDEIFANLQGTKTLKTYPLAGHENFLRKYRNEWLRDVGTFLQTTL